MAALKTLDEQVWVGEQSLRGYQIVADGAARYRARIVRDSYDHQCEAKVEAWTAVGWRVIAAPPLHTLPIFACSYVQGAKPELWHSSMRDSLDRLVRLAQKVLTNAKPDATS